MIAVITFVYNEAALLPIWRRYYGGIFGERNLFVIDHDSSDGSTRELGEINKLRLPRDALEERKRALFVASQVRALLEYFDTVIYTDCDELLVPDAGVYADLKDYIERSDFKYTAGVGLDLTHIVSLEPPLDLGQPILRQRRFARFSASLCKPLITRIPIVWETGFHSSNQPVRIDPHLYLLHLKLMDYALALDKLRQTREMSWSPKSIAAGHGDHARYDDARFTREFFTDTENLVTNSRADGPRPFEFSREIERIKAGTVYRNGIFHSSHFAGKVVELPDWLRTAF